MIRPCPKCSKKLQVLSCWNRHDAIIGRHLACGCGYSTRSYEVVAEEGKGRLRHLKHFDPEQIGLLF